MNRSSDGVVRVALIIGIAAYMFAAPWWGIGGTGKRSLHLGITIAHASSGPKDPEDAALALFKEAKTFFENGDMKGALSRLEQAWALFKQPVIALQLAEVHEKLGQPEEALEALKALDSLKLQDEDLRVKVEVRKKSLMSFLKQPLRVSVISDVSTSQVRIDDAEIRYPPFDILLPRGKHVLTASAVGYRASVQEIDVRGSVPMQVRFSLQPLTGTIAIRSGRDPLSSIQIMVDGIEWKINDEERKSNTTRPRTAKVGRHQVVCWHEGRTKDIQTISIREGEDLIVDCRSGHAQHEEVNKVWGSVALGVAAGSAIAGGYLLYAWGEDEEKAEREDLNIETNKHYFGAGLLVVAAAAGATSYYFFSRAGSDDSNPGSAEKAGEGTWGMRLCPGPGPIGLGLSFDF